MSLLTDDSSLILKKQTKPVCSKIAIPSVVVLFEKIKTSCQTAGKLLI